MGRHPLAPVRKPFCTYRKALAFTVAAFVFLLLGFAVREAEANQIGSSDNASIWVFFMSGLCLYAAVVIAWTTLRRRRRSLSAIEQEKSR